MLVLAIIVLMGGVLAYAATLTSAMHSSQAQEISAARALQAARAGLEWGRYRIRIGAACAPATNLAMPLSTGNMPVTVRCTATVHPAGRRHGGDHLPAQRNGVPASFCRQLPERRRHRRLRRAAGHRHG